MGYNSVFLILSILVLICFIIMLIYLFYQCIRSRLQKRDSSLTKEGVLDQLTKDVERLQAGEIEGLYLVEGEYRSCMHDVRKIQCNIKDIEENIQRNAASVKVLQEDLQDFSSNVTSFLEVLDARVVGLMGMLSK